MLVGALPDLTETQSGKDLMQIGVQKGEQIGKAEGQRESLLLFLEFRFKDVPDPVRQALEGIDSADHLAALTRHALRIESLNDFDVTTGAPQA